MGYRYYEIENKISNYKISVPVLSFVSYTHPQISLGKSRRKRPLGRPGSRWENGMRMDLRENDWGV
jgi:hypothetical protein